MKYSLLLILCLMPASLMCMEEDSEEEPSCWQFLKAPMRTIAYPRYCIHKKWLRWLIKKGLAEDLIKKHIKANQKIIKESSCAWAVTFSLLGAVVWDPTFICVLPPCLVVAHKYVNERLKLDKNLEAELIEYKRKDELFSCGSQIYQREA